MNTITLTNGDASADIALEGAELIRWTVAGTSLLWTADARWWPQTSPILFPVVSSTNGWVIRVDGRSYPCAMHGFAAQSRFVVLDHSASSATLELAANDETRAIFPFEFRLRACYRLEQRSLRVELTVENSGTRRLPYSIGLHPGFAWPFTAADRSGHRLEFEAPENPTVPLPVVEGSLTERTRDIPLDGHLLALTEELFEPSGMVFLNAASRHVAFRSPDGAAIELDFEDMPHIVVWTKPGAPFLCIEGWTGHRDPAGFTGDIMEKPSTRILDAAARAQHAMNFRYQEAPKS